MISESSLEPEPNAPHSPLSEPPRSAGGLIAWVLTAGMLAMLALRLIWHDGCFLLMALNSFSLYALLPAGMLLFEGLRTGRRWLAACNAALVAVYLAILVSWLPLRGEPPRIAGESLRLLSYNVQVQPDNREPQLVLDEIDHADADLLVLQEFSEEWVPDFKAHGLFERYPHHRLLTHHGPWVLRGVAAAVFSRHPLEEVRIEQLHGIPLLVARLQLDGEEVEVVNLHLSVPRGRNDQQWQQFLALQAYLATRRGRHVVLAGDFNATVHSRIYAELTKNLHDAAWQARAWPTATWPNGRTLVPPIQIDHILLSPGLACESLEYGQIGKSDHRALLARIGLAGGNGVLTSHER